RKESPLVRLALSKEALKTKSPRTSRMPRAIRWTCSSLSMTQGPAIQISRSPRKSLYLTGTRVLRLGLQDGSHPALAVLVSRANERLEQRMRLHGFGFELGVELAAEEPGVVGDFADLDVGAVGSFAGDAQTGGFELAFVFAVEFVTGAVASVDLARTGRAVGEAILGQPARPAAQPHGAAQLVDALQFT